MIAGAAIYIGGLAVTYSSILICFLSKYRGRLFLVSSIIFLGAIAVFRGAVGTDTAMYEAIVELSRSPDYLWAGREPGFVMLAEIFQLVLNSDALVVRFFAVAF